MVLADEYIRKSWVEILRGKDDAAPRLKQWIAISERQAGKPVKNLRSDRGGEFIDGDLQKWLKNRGIRHKTTPPNTPQGNAITERMNRTLQDRARSMLLHVQLPRGL